MVGKASVETMPYNLTETAHMDILALAERCGVEDIILFGSRARGDHRPRSDIDLAIQGGDFVGFSLRADEEIRTLLFIDVVELNRSVQPELLESIRRDGVVLRGKLPQNVG